MLASALKEAKSVLLDQTTLTLDSTRFHEVLSWLDANPSADESAGIRRLLEAKATWARD